jgi:polar amino acid transport system substrate-binding protein
MNRGAAPWWRAALLAALALAPAMAVAQTRSRVFVPSFWDPQHRPARPDLSTLKTIRFLTESDYPPFHFALPDGTLAGFDVDLARAICDELQLACTIQARRFDTLIDALDQGEGDALVASLPITAETRGKLDFTAPYYTTPGRFVTLTGTALGEPSPQSWAGVTVAVESGSVYEAYLKTFFPKLTLRAYPSATATRAALQAGEVAALFGDAISLSLWQNGTDARNCCSFRGGPYTESRFFGEGVGIGVKSGNATLRRALDYALASLAQRGVYTDLYLKYFPIGFY